MDKKELHEIYFGAKPSTLKYANVLRKELTESEDILWQALRNRKLNGYKFRRQHPIDKFIADFFCYEALLVVEVDGGIHLEKRQHEHDEMRTYLLNQFEIKVIRFTNQQLKKNLNFVLNSISDELSKRI